MPQGEKQESLVVFQPSGQRGYVSHGKTVMEASKEMGAEIESICGSRGTCGKCKIKMSGDLWEGSDVNSRRRSLSLLTRAEKKLLTSQQRREGYRLACQARICGDAVIFIPEESQPGKQVVRKAAGEKAIELKPALRQYQVRLSPANLTDISADWERLRAKLEKTFNLTALAIDYRALLSLPNVIRRGNWEATVSVWMDREVIKIEPGPAGGIYGVAVDIGTTTLAAYLCDLTTGEVVATSAMMNPQVSYGEDVMARISYCATSRKNLRRMNRLLVKGINQLVGEAAAEARVKRHRIVDMTVVGNTCMHHIFLNIDPWNLGKAPFPPAISGSLDIKARDLGLKISSGAYVHILPVEAGFVGADNVGVLLATELYNQDDTVLVVDIGTNGELVLGNRDRLIACSCATGPAFEGAQIKYGMRAAPGAIEKVEIAPSSREVRFKVIGKEGWNTDLEDVGAKGICGSGIIDAAAQLFLAGVIDQTGRFNADLDTPRLRTNQDRLEFVIAWAYETSIGQDIVICDEDIRNIQLAKGAMCAGAKIIMRRLNLEKLDKIILAGAFGSYVNKESAAIIGLFPDSAQENVSVVGNAAGDGARMALLNVDKRTDAGKVARQVEYVELATEPEFSRLFAQAMWFPRPV